MFIFVVLFSLFLLIQLNILNNDLCVDGVATKLFFDPPSTFTCVLRHLWERSASSYVSPCTAPVFPLAMPNHAGFSKDTLFSCTQSPSAPENG